MTSSIRYPAYPLVTHDPYFSIWSFSDDPTQDYPHHWTGADHTLICGVRIDGSEGRCCISRLPVPSMNLVSREVFPTRTVYTYEELGIRFRITFLTPALLYDLEVLSRPVTYVSFDYESIDGKAHQVSVFFGFSTQCCINKWEKVQWGRLQKKGMSCLFAGCADQEILGKSGDDLRIDWGWQILSVPDQFRHASAIASASCAGTFLKTGEFPEEDRSDFPVLFAKGYPMLCTEMELGKGSGKSGSGWLMLAYNDLFSIEYLNQRLKGYWTLQHKDFSAMLAAAMKDYPVLKEECAAFDSELMSDAEQCGGKEYAGLLSIVYRQSIAAHKLVVDLKGRALFFSKENFSNGCIATVDITYPSSPLFLLMQPELVKGLLIPMLEYVKTKRWKFPFAPHDLGVYPLANGQVYGGGEETEENQMPVEESGNLLLLAAALAKFTEDTAFLKEYETVFRKWAEYLSQKGFDPENQLCTDDFAGHLAHNANLSIKAILALAGYGLIAEKNGNPEEAAHYRKLAKEFAGRWMIAADDGDCYRLAFDREGSWSQKYNLIWDSLLELDCFPASVAEKEMKWYRSHQNRYGLPLDSRKSYTKLDWILWTASLTGKAEDFRALLMPVWKWLQEGVSRVPVTDWYETTGDGAKVGFQARAVVGGCFIRLLMDPVLRRKWQARSQRKA